MKHIIFGFIAFIHHNKYIQMTQTGTHQYTMYHNIQILLEMSQWLYNLHLLIMSFNIRDKGIYNSFEVVPLFKRFTWCWNFYVLITFTSKAYSIIQICV